MVYPIERLGSLQFSRYGKTFADHLAAAPNEVQQAFIKQYMKPKLDQASRDAYSIGLCDTEPVCFYSKDSEGHAVLKCAC